MPKWIKELWKQGNPIFFLILSEAVDYFIETQRYVDIVTALFALKDASVVIASRWIVALIGRIVTLMPICIVAMQSANRSQQLERSQAAFFSYIRKSAVASMKVVGICQKSISADDINIRVFTKEGTKLVFQDIKGCYSHEIPGGLKFDLKDKEGLVTAAYNERTGLCELEDGADSKYNLSERNKTKVKDLKFIVAIPVFSEKGELKCIVCFDSIKQVCSKPENKQRIVDHLTVPAYDFYENLVEGGVKK